MAPCDFPSLNVPAVSAFDFAVTPVLLTTVPADLLSTNAARASPVNWQATRPPPTPLYLTHLALLN